MANRYQCDWCKTIFQHKKHEIGRINFDGSGEFSIAGIYLDTLNDDICRECLCEVLILREKRGGKKIHD